MISSFKDCSMFGNCTPGMPFSHHSRKDKKRLVGQKDNCIQTLSTRNLHLNANNCPGFVYFWRKLYSPRSHYSSKIYSKNAAIVGHIRIFSFARVMHDFDFQQLEARSRRGKLPTPMSCSQHGILTRGARAYLSAAIMSLPG